MSFFSWEDNWPFKQFSFSETTWQDANLENSFLFSEDFTEMTTETEPTLAESATPPAPQKGDSTPDMASNESVRSLAESIFCKLRLVEQFHDLTVNEASNVEMEYTNAKRKIYSMALRHEFFRWQRDITRVPLVNTGISPRSPTLLLDLHFSVLSKILNLLDTIDVFHLSQVCKAMRKSVESAARSLVKSEHAVTTHLISFRYWMQKDYSMDGARFLLDWSLHEKRLIQWCVRISVSLEGLILCASITYGQLIEILKHCPKLKHIQVSCKPSKANLEQLQMLCKRDSLPSLTSFLEDSNEQYPESVQLSLHWINTYASLSVFRGHLRLPSVQRSCNLIDYQLFFTGLLALDLLSSDLETLESLAELDCFSNLMYFRIGNRLHLTRFGDYRRRYTLGVCKFLALMKNLEFLSVPCSDLVILQTLIELKAPLKSVYFGHGDKHDGWWWDDIWSFPFHFKDRKKNMKKKLLEFQSLFVNENEMRSVDEVTVVVPDNQAVSFLREQGLNFNFQIGNNEVKDKGLLSLSIRRKLGFEF